MKTFKVDITSITYYSFEEIEAETEDEALEIAWERIHNCNVEGENHEHEHDVIEL